jgi:tetratricopeptide (TPR) repeat protein
MGWMRRHPWVVTGTLLVLAAFLSGTGYRIVCHLRAQGQIRDAQRALSSHEWARARKHLNAALDSRPDDPDTHLLAARAERRLEHLDEAEKHLDACQRLQGGETQATRIERALLKVHRGDLAGSEEFLRSAVSNNDPDAVEILDILSAAFILEYRVADAHRCLDDLLARQPDHFDALVRRGWTAQSQSWYAEAVTSLDKALTLRPDADNVRLALAELQVVLGRFADARAHFVQLQKKQPDNSSVLFGLARSQAGLGEREEALHLLDRVLADDPDDWKALGERGWLMVQIDRPADGERDLRRAVALAPPDLTLLVRLSDCLNQLGKKDEAFATRQEADRIKADMQQAGELGDTIREKDPNNPDLRCQLACVLLRLGKTQDALHWFRTALDKDPAHRPTHESLADFYAKAGDTEKSAYHRRFLRGSINDASISPEQHP